MFDSGVKRDFDFPVVAQFVLVDAVEIWIIKRSDSSKPSNSVSEDLHQTYNPASLKLSLMQDSCQVKAG